MVSNGAGKLLGQFEKYLHDTLEISLTCAKWKKGAHLPIILQDRYQFFETRILDLPCLLMVDHGDEREESPATLRKHIAHLQLKWSGPVVFVRDRIDFYRRQRMIEQKIPFVVPGNQMYLPMLGFDLREHFRNLRTAARTLRPSSQAVLFHALLQDDNDLSPTSLAKRLGYTLMTMSRSIDDLESAGLGKISGTGKGRGKGRRLLLKGPKRELWDKAQALLNSPVKHSGAYFVDDATLMTAGMMAGDSALAHYSMMAEPKKTAKAFSRKKWDAIRTISMGLVKNAMTPAMKDEAGAWDIEVWSYSPALFARDGVVDRLSLFVSLRDTPDERVKSALNKMIEEVSW